MKRPAFLQNFRLTIRLKIFLGILAVVIFSLIEYGLLYYQVSDIIVKTTEITETGNHKKKILESMTTLGNGLSQKTAQICVSLANRPLTSSLPFYERERDRLLESIRKSCTKNAAIGAFSDTQGFIRRYMVHLSDQTRRLDMDKTDEAVNVYNTFGFEDSIVPFHPRTLDSSQAAVPLPRRAGTRTFESDLKESFTALAGQVGPSRQADVRALEELYNRMRHDESVLLTQAVAGRYTLDYLASLRRLKDTLAVLATEPEEKEKLASLDSLYRILFDGADSLVHVLKRPNKMMDVARKLGDPGDHDQAAQLVSTHMTAKFKRLNEDLGQLCGLFMGAEEEIIRKGIEKLTERRKDITRVVRIGAIMILLSFVLAFYLSLQISRPLQSLRQATRIAANGKYDALIKIRSDDEIGDLTADFNKMMTDLAKLDAMKSEFVSHITHDLKSPIATIKQGLELISTHSAGPLTPEQEKVIAIALKAQERLSDLVSNLLDTAKLESGTFKLNRQPVEVVAFLEEVVSGLLPQMQARKIWLTKQIYFKRLEIRADPSQLARVLTNLIGNAIKFTPENGRITIEAEEVGPDVQFSVIDTGPGIAAGELNNIFKSFYQVEGTQQKGSGLGLSIAKQLVELHGGKIWCESDLRYGTAFFITLPKN